jgi:glycosyltransferase involved in cell wall biosynthesis
MKLSVVIPAFNEAENISAVVTELISTIGKCQRVSDYQIIIVDDHSSDETYEAVSALANSKVNCIRLSRRSGSHTAIRAGLHRADGDAVLCISADGQDNPEMLAEMISHLDSGSHTVWGIRESRDEGFLDKLSAKLFYKLLMSFTSNDLLNIDLSNADFYLLSRKTVNAINQCQERNTSLFGLIIWLGFKQTGVTYKRRERFSGKSKWNFSSRMRLAKDWIIAFSGIPLKMITYIGIGTAILGFAYAIFIFICALLKYTTPGWAEAVIITLVVCGAIMTMLGVMGEYMWRTLEETRTRPLYFIEDETKK